MTITVTPIEVVYGQPEQEYRQHPALNQSAMKELLVSPAHYMAAYGPDAEPSFPSASMILGTAFHCRVLEPERFDKRYRDKGATPGEPTVAELKEMLKAAGVKGLSTMNKPELMALAYPEGLPVDNRIALPADTYKSVLTMADILRAHETAGEWFSPGRDYRRWNEVSFYARNNLGQEMKARTDRLLVDDEAKVVWILDLKSTTSASPKEFPRSVVKFAYDLQSWWYTLLVQAAFPGYRIEFLFTAQESTRPYGIGLYRATDKVLALGARKGHKALHLHAQCKALDYWPGYATGIVDLELPAWAESLEEEESLDGF